MSSAPGPHEHEPVAHSQAPHDFPRRYRAVRQLGAGGSGEVWEVEDRATNERLALKLLIVGADHAELLSLVREASALSGLEGLGLPRVLRYGTLGDGRTFIVRELVSGESLREHLRRPNDDATLLVRALIDACAQLSEVHRAGLLHGDLKPGNLVVDEHGRGRLVDLGLSTPFSDDAQVIGLTPDYAAPELLRGQRALTVRTEIYSLGATLRELLEHLPLGATHDAVRAVAMRAMRDDPHERYPSVDEFARELGAAIGVSYHHDEPARLWPVLGIDDFSRQLLDAALGLEAGQSLHLQGPLGAGRSTLLRRLAWSLGASGHPVAWLESSEPRLVELELGVELPDGAFVLVDDFGEQAGAAHAHTTIAEHAATTRQIFVHDERWAPPSGAQVLAVPPLDIECCERLVALTLPSLPALAQQRLLQRTDRRPGALRTIAEELASHAVVSAEELDELLLRDHAPLSEVSLERLTLAVARGRFRDASRLAEALERGEPSFGLSAAQARIKTAVGDFDGADRSLTQAEAQASGELERQTARVLRARLWLRRGESQRARDAAEQLSQELATPNAESTDLAADAHAVWGIACLLLGDTPRAFAALTRGLELARGERAKAIAQGSLAIAYERSGKDDEAKRSYGEALQHAERAEDAWTATTTHNNLAGLLRKLGDLASASRSFEASIDMGLRAGASLLVELSRINLLNLDIYLGRYARAEALVATLSGHEAQLSAGSRAQLLGLRGELAERRGDPHGALAHYAACVEAYRELGRHADAAEAALTALLLRAQLEPTPSVLLERYRELVPSAGPEPSWLEEHEALAAWTLGMLSPQPEEALAALDRAVRSAESKKQNEIEWQARKARAQRHERAGAQALAELDRSQALRILEQTARALPRDLREVFWNDPRRRALRQPAPRAPQVPGFGDVSAFGTSSGGALSRTALDSPSRHFSASLNADDRLLRVLAITRELARERDLDRLLALVVEHAIGLARADRCAILLRDDDDSLTLHTSQNARGVTGDSRAFSRSVAKLAIERGEPIVTDNARGDARFESAKSVQLHELGSLLCLPIHGPPPANQPIGALYLESKRRFGHEENELATLATFADQAAIAIANARMWAQAEQSAQLLAQKSAELARANTRLSEVLERRTEQLQNVRQDLRRARSSIEGHFGYQGLVGQSTAIRKVYSFIEQIKDTDVPVLILGESGTGKEVVARAIHQASARAKAPFVGINCGAIPANLLESELFGHIRGAFTGADRERAGLLRDAKDGTVLLDEIGEMPLPMQAGILRALQERTVRPLGGNEELPISARLIAATNRDLEAMVAERSFREDLFYRIHVATLRLPALRERRDDIPMLIDHLMTRFSTRYRREKKPIDKEAMRLLVEHAWPGNVRQLEHVLLSAWLMGDSDEITADDLSLSTSRDFSAPAEASASASAPRSAQVGERERIVQALAREQGNRVRAAETLGIPRRTFYRRLKQYGLL